VIKSLYEKMDSLEKIISGELQGDFDLFSVQNGNSGDCSEQLEELRRLLYSLEVFISREEGAFTVIFLGHFSAAKSSTLNWVLNLWGQENVQRATGNTTTDSCVTILTHSSNKLDLKINTSHKGVPIEVSKIENDLLKDMVFIDTPGAGEFANDERNLVEYLFWSDLIVFCSNSNETFGHFDLQVLRAKQKHLPNTPLLFGFTKVDNLFTEINKNTRQLAGFEQENFNDVVGSALGKLDDEVQGHQYTAEDFYPLVTLEKISYGVEELVQAIITTKETRDSNSIREMFANRYNAFAKRGVECRDFFASYGGEQVNLLQSHFEQLEINRERFTKLVTFQDSAFSYELKEVSETVDKKHKSAINQLSTKLLEPIYSVNVSDNTFQTQLNRAIENIRLEVRDTLSLSIEQYLDEVLSKHTKLDSTKLVTLVVRDLERLILNFDGEAITFRQSYKDLKDLIDKLSNFYNRLQSVKLTYMSNVIPEVNEALKSKYLDQEAKFRENLNDFTEAAAKMANLSLFKNNAMINEINKMIDQVKLETNESVLPDISSRLIDQSEVNNLSDNTYKELRQELKLKEIEFECRQKSPLELLIKLQPESSSSPVFGFEKKTIHDTVENIKDNAKRDLAESMLDIERNKRSENKTKLAIITSTVVLAALCICYFYFPEVLSSNNEDISSDDSASKAVTLSIIANSLTTIFGIILAGSITFIGFLKNKLKKLIGEYNSDYDTTVVSAIRSNLTDTISRQISEKHLKYYKENSKQHFSKELATYNDEVARILKLKNFVEKSCENAQFSLDSIYSNVEQKLDRENWMSFFHTLAEDAKNERVDRLYDRMRTLVSKAKDKVNSIKEIEIA